MSALRKPSLGPIIGHTTDTTCRIWIRGVDPDDQGTYLHSNRRTVGVIALTEIDGKSIPNPDVLYFRLHRKNDRTVTSTLGEDPCIKSGSVSQPLTPNTAYTARVCTLNVDDPFDDDQNVSDDILADRLLDVVKFVSKALDKWAYENRVTLDFSRPGKPTDNPFIKSFNGTLGH